MIGLTHRPLSQIGQGEAKGLALLGFGDLLELQAGRAQLLGERVGELGIVSQGGLLQSPVAHQIGFRQGAFLPAGNLLQGAQAVGKKPKMVAFEGRQQRRFEFGQLFGGQHGPGTGLASLRGVSRKPQEWPSSRRQWIRSTWQSGNVWRMSWSS